MPSAWERLKARLLDRPGSVDLSGLAAVIELAAGCADTLRSASDADLHRSLAGLPADFVHDDQRLATFLALTRELADRQLGLRPFDVQLQAAAAMLRGTSVELATGEGKTLVGAIVAAGLVRTRHRAHVLSANDYLATRDAEWMGPLLAAAGATVAAVTSTTPAEQRREAYRADVVYLPVTEAGFDVLRDRLCLDVADRVGICPDVAVLDEADAVLLDEGRVPLVLAGESSDTVGADWELAEFVARLDEHHDYQVDHDRRTVHLTEAGLQAAEWRFPDVDLFGADHDLLARLHTALHAEALLTRDVDYVIEDGRVRLVSPSRGRVEALQRWPEGLQEAVEAKEHLEPSSGVEILDQLLVRDLIGLYTSVVGMSATLVSAASEITELYDLDVGGLPPHRPCIRIDEPDRLYETADERDAAVANLVTGAHDDGQPVLVATQSVADSERFAALLTECGLESVVLNAKNDAHEAGIIALAGTPGWITVSTQMTGRGTDIRLADGVAERGGLLILCLGRFPTKRLDDQLRGRAGRQGDPGRTIFLTSLDDGLITGYAPDHRPPRDVGEDGRVFDRRLLSWPDHAQRVADGQQHSLRDLAHRYGRLLARHRERLLELREKVLTSHEGSRLLDEVASDRMDELRSQLAGEELDGAARLIVLTCVDRRWSDHLAYAAAVREGIHLRALAREEPLHAFNRLIAESFASLTDAALADAAEILTHAPVVEGHLDLAGARLHRPGATWTYMVTDDHFGTEFERIGKAVKKDLRAVRGMWRGVTG